MHAFLPRAVAACLGIAAAGVYACGSSYGAADDVSSVPDTGNTLGDGGSDGAFDGAHALPAKGAIVVGGIAPSAGMPMPFLTVLAPETGKELPMAREQLHVVAVQYDGLRDLWYVFESSGTTALPTPSDRVLLHIRSLDTYTGAWTEIQSIKVPTLVGSTLVAVLRGRLVYLAYDASPGGATAETLVIVDTTSPAQPAVVSATRLPAAALGLIGTRATKTLGGVVTLIFDQSTGVDGGACGAGNCLTTQSVTVGAGGNPSFGTLLDRGAHAGTATFGSYGATAGTPSDYIGFVSTPPMGMLQDYLPSNGAPVGSPIAFSINDPFLRPLAFADCLGQALLIGTNTETAVTSIPVSAAGVADRGIMPHTGQSVHFEPYTSTVLAPFAQGDSYELTALTLGGTRSAPTLTLRQAPQWAPPADLRPVVVATRSPIPFICP